MISLSDAIRLESNNPAVNSFKPWWEVAIDYTLNGFLLVVLFALAGVTISGTPGLACLPTDNNQSTFNYGTNNYVNAKCTTHVDGHFLIIFPYIIFLQWLLLFVLHISWFNLPGLKAFLSSIFDSFTTFNEVAKSQPTVKNKLKQRKQKVQECTIDASLKQDNIVDDDSSSGDESDLTSESNRKARLAHVIGWLQYLLQFKYHLVNIYAAKTLATCILTVIISVGIISWLIAFRWKTAFRCDLRGAIPAPYDVNECSFAAAPYVYSMMVLNVVFAILLFLCNLRALCWLVKYVYVFNNYVKTWGGKYPHPLKDKPGFYDYYFCLKLFKANSAEGAVVCKIIETAFDAFGDKAHEEMLAASELALAIPDDPQYSKYWFICTEILQGLGMKHKRSIGSHDGLWAALANSLSEETTALTGDKLREAEEKVRKEVVEELLAKHVLFKDLINKDDRCPVFEDYLEDIKNNEPREDGIIEDHYVLMAYAILYRVNVVVIRAQKSSLLYEPEKPEENQTIKFITFIPPHYYHAATVHPATVHPNVTADKENAGLNFVTDQVAQTALMKKVNELWETKGYAAYKKTLESILPQNLLYQPAEQVEELDIEKDEGSGVRLRKPKKSKKNVQIEHFALVETV